MTETDLRALRADVTEIILSYASGIDRRDWDRLRSCFTDDCDADYGVIGHWRSADEITTWMADTHAPCGHTLHRLTNFDIEPSATGATARTYVDAVVMFGDNKAGTNAHGYYDDELVLVDGSWRIARRRFTTVGLYLIPGGTPLDLDT